MKPIVAMSEYDNCAVLCALKSQIRPLNVMLQPP